jgi:membrane associated rhomboid family serine protease
MKVKTRLKNFNHTFPLIIGIIVFIWIIELVNRSLNHMLCVYGIYPRTQIGLRGILFSPLLHGSIDHLILNTLPFIVLGSFVASDGKKKFIKVTLFIMLLTGFATWLVAAAGFHVGLSGVIFGYFGYLVAIGYYNRNFFSILIAAVVIFFYGGIVWGILPVEESISWEGHLFGLLTGFLAAKFIR